MMIKNRTVFKIGQDSSWNKVILKHRTIEQIELEEWEDGADLTVYFYDTDEPFPINALRGETREDLENAWDEYESSRAELVE